MSKVFLGGTCAKSSWRDEIMPLIKVEYFNPVVAQWTSVMQAIEEEEKQTYCNVHLYVITSEMIGVFSIAEVIESVHMPKKSTIFQVIPTGFSDAQLRSLKAVVGMVIKHGGIAYVDGSLRRTSEIINNSFK